MPGNHCNHITYWYWEILEILKYIKMLEYTRTSTSARIAAISMPNTKISKTNEASVLRPYKCIH